MKYSLSFLILFMLHLSLFSQDAYFKWFPSDNHECIYNAIELSDGSFLLSGESGPVSNTALQRFFLKIDHAGNILQYETATNSDTSTLYSCLFTKNEEDTCFYATVDYRHIQNGQTYTGFSIEKYTEGLTLIAQKRFHFPAENGLLPQYCCAISDSLFLIQSAQFTYLPVFHVNGNVVSKFNYQFDSLGSYFEPGYGITSFGLRADTVSNTIKCFNFFPTNYSIVSEINQAMQLVRKNYLPRIITTASVTNLSSSSYLFTGVGIPAMGFKQHINVWKCNNNGPNTCNAHHNDT
jgi:hypothetical protein